MNPITVRARARVFRLRPGRAGFTLVEMIMVSGLSLMLATIALGVTSVSSRALSAMQGQGAVQMQLNTALGVLSQDARLATNATSTATTLTLTVPSITAGGAVLTGVFDTLTYTFDAATGVLQRTVTLGAGSARSTQTLIAARGITQVAFTLLGAPTNAVTIALWDRQTMGEYVFDGTISTQVAFRNI